MRGQEKHTNEKILKNASYDVDKESQKGNETPTLEKQRNKKGSKSAMKGRQVFSGFQIRGQKRWQGRRRRGVNRGPAGNTTN